MAMPNELSRRAQNLEIDGLSIGYSVAGNGGVVIMFPAEEAAPDQLLLRKLSESNRVISLDLPSRIYPNVSEWAEKMLRGFASLGIEHCSLIGISAGAQPALALAAAAPEGVDRLILLSPLLPEDQLIDLASIKTATLVLVGTRDAPGAIESGRRCRERIPSCHLSFVYGAGHALTNDRPKASLDPIMQFLQEGEQFIIFRDSQMIRP
jgi:pimeloyl-ACP methyl ester carboxylesterase